VNRIRSPGQWFHHMPTEADRDLMNLYWEAVWLEGARTLVAETVKAAIGTAGDRRPVSRWRESDWR